VQIFISLKNSIPKKLWIRHIHGLECAIVVMEKAINLSYTGQRSMIESLKKNVLENKVKAVIRRL